MVRQPGRNLVAPFERAPAAHSQFFGQVLGRRALGYSRPNGHAGGRAILALEPDRPRQDGVHRPAL